MSEFTAPSYVQEPIVSFEKGIDLASPQTTVPKGGYEDALNILLSKGRHPKTVKVDSLLDSAITWPKTTIRWMAPFTSTAYNSSTGALSFNTHLLIHYNDGSFYRYDAGSPGTTTLLRRIATTGTKPVTHLVYDQWLCVLNGRDAPLKYGQHLNWDGIGDTTPYLIYLGAKLISPLISGPPTGETSHTLSGGCSFVADASVPGSKGCRLSTHCLKLGAGGGNNLQIAYSTTRNFTDGPRPYTGTGQNPDFVSTDKIAVQYRKTATAGTFTLRFHTVATTDYYDVEFGVAASSTSSGPLTADGDWHTVWRTISAASATGVPDWASIVRVDFITNDAANDVYIDDPVFIYANAPPAAAVGCTHKDRIVLGGVPVTGSNNDNALGTLFWSYAGGPDYYPAGNQHVITGGPGALTRSNRITALREYGDSVIVGTPNAIFAWTVGTDPASSLAVPSRSVVTTELGIDSHRAVVETPAGSLLFPWQRGFYILRQTGRGYASEKIAPLLENIWLEEPWWTVGIRDELTKTIRFWWRDKISGDPTATNNGIIFDFAAAQFSGESVWAARTDTYADFAAEVYVNGVRETLWAQYDDSDIWRLGSTAGGAVISALTLPWMSLQGKDRVTKWAGAVIPYASTTPIRVQIRYASHPGEFEDAVFEDAMELPPTPGPRDQGRVMFGKPARWAQIRLKALEHYMEIFPPIEVYAGPTMRQP